MIPSEVEEQVSFNKLVDWEDDGGGTGIAAGTAARRGTSQSHRQWMSAGHAKICNIQSGVQSE